MYTDAVDMISEKRLRKQIDYEEYDKHLCIFQSIFYDSLLKIRFQYRIGPDYRYLYRDRSQSDFQTRVRRYHG